MSVVSKDEYDYEAYDADVDDLRHEIKLLDTQVSSQLSDSRNVTPTLAEQGLREIYNAISSKYGVDLEYKEFRDFISSVADETKLTTAMNEALGSKVITSLTQRTQMKLMITMSYLVDKSLQLIEKETNTVNALTPELIGMIDKTVQWYQTLQQIKNEVHLGDPDKTMEILVESSSDSTNKTTKAGTDLALIKQIAEDIKNSK